MSENRPPVDRPPVGYRRAESLVLVHTGDGKGKSTAAFGMLLRAAGTGWRSAVIQFIKSGDWRTGEEEVATRLGVDWWTLGDGFTWDSHDLDQSRRLAGAAWEKAAGIIAEGQHQLVVLDEITYPINWGWIDLEAVIDVVKNRPRGVSVVLTGRDASPELIDIADTVTEMRKVRHAFDAGIAAKRGIDY